jgi:tRNA dimethylallyltransferase|tara:strand:+ start:351 stop:1346 length:996 start_codon:yes stop_codon:yes gene_type:complete
MLDERTRPVDEQNLPAVVFLMGPTASGKTDIAVELARRFPFEIISVDSTQVYRGMDIGTAKPDARSLQQIPQHLVNIREPDAPYSAADFRSDALPLMADIVARKRIPLLVGGTMMYFKALREGLADLPSADPKVRKRIARLAAEKGWQAVHRKLQEVDPASASRIHHNDPQRLQRALEVYEVSGRTLTEHRQEQVASTLLPYRLCQIAILPAQRSALFHRIEERYLQMLADGLVEEVTELYERGSLSSDLPSMKAVGYRQIWQYLDGQLTYQQMVAQGMTATRQLAKRQLTWLRSWPDLHGVSSDCDNLIDEVLKILRIHFILDVVEPGVE